MKNQIQITQLKEQIVQVDDQMIEQLEDQIDAQEPLSKAALKMINLLDHLKKVEDTLDHLRDLQRELAPKLETLEDEDEEEADLDRQKSYKKNN